MYRLNSKKRPEKESEPSTPKMILGRADIKVIAETLPNPRPSILLSYEQQQVVRILLSLQSLYKSVGIETDFTLEDEVLDV